jgi:hypothetical protein
LLIDAADAFQRAHIEGVLCAAIAGTFGFELTLHLFLGFGLLAADEDDSEAGPVAELVSLEEADAGEEKVPAAADDDVEIEAADDTILEEEDSDDVGDLIDGEIGEEER